MAVNNVSGPGGPNRPVSRGQQTGSTRQQRIDRLDTVNSGVRSDAVPITEQPVRDIVEVSADEGFVRDLVRTVESMDEKPRGDRVRLATERVQSGYYNAPAVIARISANLVNGETGSK